MPALTPFVEKCYGERPAPVFFQKDSGERQKIEFANGVHQGDAMGPALFACQRIREELELRVLKPLLTSTTSASLCQIQHELRETDIAINPSKTVVLPLQGHVPTPKEITLLGGMVFTLRKGVG